METLTRWQDPTIDDLIKENLELKRKLREADEAVEYWQLECDKRSKVLDKALYWLSENTHYTDFNVDKLVLDENVNLKELLELLEEIE